MTGLTGLTGQSMSRDHSAMQAMQTGLTGFGHRSDQLVQTEPCTMRSDNLFSAFSSMVRILVAIMIIFM